MAVIGWDAGRGSCCQLLAAIPTSVDNSNKLLATRQQANPTFLFVWPTDVKTAVCWVCETQRKQSGSESRGDSGSEASASGKKSRGEAGAASGNAMNIRRIFNDT